MWPRPRLRSICVSSGGRPESNRRSKAWRGSSTQILTRLHVAAQLIRLVRIVYCRRRPAAGGTTSPAWTNINASYVFYPDIVAILVEVSDMMALAVNGLRRDQGVGQGHRPQPRLAHETFIVASLLRRAIDLQIDFADCVAPGLSAFVRRPILLVSNTTCIVSSQIATSSARRRPSGDFA